MHLGMTSCKTGQKGSGEEARVAAVCTKEIWGRVSQKIKGDGGYEVMEVN